MILDARQNGEVLYHMSDQDVQYSPDPLVLKNSVTDVKNSLDKKIRSQNKNFTDFFPHNISLKYFLNPV